MELNKTQFMTGVRHLQVSALQCHFQGGFLEQINASPTRYSRYYIGLIGIVKIFIF